MSLTKADLQAAFEAGVTAFLGVLNKKIEARSQGELPTLPTKQDAVLQALIGSYVGAFQARYGAKARPDVGGKSQGVLKRILRDYSPDQARAIIFGYLKMEDTWFAQKRYDLVTLESNIQKVLVEITGNREALEGFSNLRNAAKQAGITLPEGL